jgi:hypothetical protein
VGATGTGDPTDFFGSNHWGSPGFYGKIPWKIWVDYQMVEFYDHAIFTPSVSSDIILRLYGNRWGINHQDIRDNH